MNHKTTWEMRIILLLTSVMKCKFVLPKAKPAGKTCSRNAKIDGFCTQHYKIHLRQINKAKPTAGTDSVSAKAKPAKAKPAKAKPVSAKPSKPSSNKITSSRTQGVKPNNALLKAVKKNPSGAAKTADLEDLRKFLRSADVKYFSGDPIISDDTYDDVLRVFRARDLDAGNEHDESIGIPVLTGKRKRRALPLNMGSTIKIKVGDAGAVGKFNRWVKKYGSAGVVVSHKLDGASGIYCHGKTAHTLQSREGNVLDHLIPILGLPKLPVGHCVRGEFIMSKDQYEKHYANDYSMMRTMISGQVNADPDSVNLTIVKRARFVAYEYISNISKSSVLQDLTTSEQFDKLEELGFDVAAHTTLTLDKLTIEYLEEALENGREHGEYEIDGLVVTANVNNDRSNTDSHGNPRYSIAFKKNLASVEATVFSVNWSISSSGRINPVVQFGRIWINGTQIDFATGFNARFVKNNEIGPGSKIKIVKSGEVIPKITEVIEGTGASMPDFDYKWDDNHVFIYATADSGQAVLDKMEEKAVLRFVNKLKALVKQHGGAKIGLGPTGVAKIYQHGITTLHQLLTLEIEDLEGIEGMGEKTINNVVLGIKGAIKLLDIPLLVAAGSLLGPSIGARATRPLFEHEDCASFMNIAGPSSALLDDIAGLGSVKSEQILDKWSNFWTFWQNMPAYMRPLLIANTSGATKEAAAELESAAANPLLDGQMILITGFRDAALSSQIAGHTTNSMSKMTILVVKDDSTSNKKTEKALERGVPVMTKDDFVAKYLSAVAKPVKSKPVKSKPVKSKRVAKSKPTIESDDSLEGQFVLLTGFRDADLSARLGNHVSKNFKKTTIMVVKNKNTNNAKTRKALSAGVPIYTKDEFIAKYM